MGSSEEYIDFVVDQIQSSRTCRVQKLFGDYCVYLDSKPIVLVCDDTCFIKIRPEMEKLMKNAKTGFPYKGAKPHYILDIDEYLQSAP
jgi:TfoX/Sxy family transcriptional regulator of competence genes